MEQREIFDRYYNYVYAIVSRILREHGTAEDAEECTADVFLEVFRRLDTIRPDGLQAYLGTAARNRAIDLARTLTRHARNTASLGEEAAGDLPSGEDLERNSEQAETARLLLEQIRALGEPDATILIQKFYYGSTAEEIASGLGMNAAAVRKRCSRALKRLREQLTAAGIGL